MTIATLDDAALARNRLAREKGLAAMAAVKPAAGAVIRYASRGRVAVIGDMRALEFAPRLLGNLQPLVILTEGVEEPGVPLIPLGGRDLELEGHLGDFTLNLGARGTPGFERVRVDLVLDLQPEPLLDMPLPPPGYLRSNLEEPALAAAIVELQSLTGTFEKPRFFDYDPSLCAHQRSGKTACTNCIDACPAEAIRSIVDAVQVDADRCQGGGICATACPSGAIRYRWPRAEESLEQVKRLLSGYLQAGGMDPVLVVMEAELAGAADLPPNHLPFPVEELASLGLEFWFGALAHGARRVVLYESSPLPERVDSALEVQLATGRRILEALGYPAGVLQRVPADSSLERETVAAMPELEPARYAPMGGKRQLFYLALDHLQKHAPRPRPLATLEAGAPFGTVILDGRRCTLCKACVGACPGHALQVPAQEPALQFLEANCLQCGMCTRTCPEDAIAISPRLLLDADKRNRVRELHREEPFHCIECGKAFATRSVVNRMQQALKGHWMFQDERARRRLEMCDQCRVADIALDPEAMERAGGIRLDH